jgi:hypothetical protein
MANICSGFSEENPGIQRVHVGSVTVLETDLKDPSQPVEQGQGFARRCVAENSDCFHAEVPPVGS